VSAVQTGGRLALEVAADADAACRRAASRIAAAARLGARRRGSFSLALSGGRGAPALLRALLREDMPWRAVQLFQVDERAAPQGSPARNWSELERALGPLRLRDSQLHPMPVDCADLEVAAAAYARELGAVAGHPPELDLVQLGLGADGHTASLVPADPVLVERGRSVAPTGGCYQGHRRLTLTYLALGGARRVLWLVTGSAKRSALAGLLAGDPRLPASHVQRCRALVLADAEAAAGSPG
jgi:6-phosphogluconolactonase